MVASIDVDEDDDDEDEMVDACMYEWIDYVLDGCFCCYLGFDGLGLGHHDHHHLHRHHQ